MNLEQIKRMAGVGPSTYESWRRVPLRSGGTLSESKEAPGGRSLPQSQIRRIARMLQDDRIGGYHPLTEAAAEDYTKKATAHKDAADRASKAASATGQQNPLEAHSKHSAAADAHRKAAKYHGAMGNDRAAHYHDKMAGHHDRHADMHKKDADSRVEKDPFKGEPKKAKSAEPAKAKPKGKKKGFLGRLKDKIISKVKGAGGIDWAAKSKEIGKKDKRDKKIAAAAAAHKQKTDADKKATRSRAMDRIAKRPEYAASKAARSAEKKGSSADAAKARTTASHEYLHKALKHFHAGDHDHSVKMLNMAIKHAKKASGHKSDQDAQSRQAVRRAAPVGPRAAVGRTGGR